VTTREPRDGEVDGVSYRFVSDREFDEMVAQGRLLEWAEVFGRRYGTPSGPLDEALAAGGDAILEIDVQGARSVHAKMPQAVLIFIMPPASEALEQRLRERGTEDEAELATRLGQAEAEMAESRWFDHVVVNDDLDRAVGEVLAMIDASHPSGKDPS
jgi:guanylate kinase